MALEMLVYDLTACLSHNFREVRAAEPESGGEPFYGACRRNFPTRASGSRPDEAGRFLICGFGRAVGVSSFLKNDLARVILRLRWHSRLLVCFPAGGEFHFHIHLQFGC